MCCHMSCLCKRCVLTCTNSFTRDSLTHRNLPLIPSNLSTPLTLNRITKKTRKSLSINAELMGTCRTKGVRLSQPKTHQVPSSLAFHISSCPCPTGALGCAGHKMKDEVAMPVKNHPIQKGRQCSGALRAPWGFPSPSHISGLGPRLHFPIFQFVSLGYYCTMKM